jgi:hypothetical protein
VGTFSPQKSISNGYSKWLFFGTLLYDVENINKPQMANVAVIIRVL